MQLCEITVQYGFIGSDQEKINGSHSAAELLRHNWDTDINILESFVVLHLGTTNRVKGIHRLSKGGINATLADVRLIFSTALKTLATGIIIAHNHPSGDVRPSHLDKLLTKKMQAASELLEIKLLDHIIISPSGEYYSFADEGEM